MARGSSHRGRADPDDPRIGEEVAVARAAPARRPAARHGGARHRGVHGRGRRHGARPLRESRDAGVSRPTSRGSDASQSATGAAAVSAE